MTMLIDDSELRDRKDSSAYWSGDTIASEADINDNEYDDWHARHKGCVADVEPVRVDALEMEDTESQKYGLEEAFGATPPSLLADAPAKTAAEDAAKRTATIFSFEFTGYPQAPEEMDYPVPLPCKYREFDLPSRPTSALFEKRCKYTTSP